jgi:hypothetical protein
MSKAAKAAVRGQKWQQYATGRGLTFTDRLCPVSPVASRHITGFSSCFDTIMEVLLVLGLSTGSNPD